MTYSYIKYYKRLVKILNLDKFWHYYIRWKIQYRKKN